MEYDPHHLDCTFLNDLMLPDSNPGGKFMSDDCEQQKQQQQQQVTMMAEWADFDDWLANVCWDKEDDDDDGKRRLGGEGIGNGGGICSCNRDEMSSPMGSCIMSHSDEDDHIRLRKAHNVPLRQGPRGDDGDGDGDGDGDVDGDGDIFYLMSLVSRMAEVELEFEMTSS